MRLPLLVLLVLVIFLLIALLVGLVLRSRKRPTSARRPHVLIAGVIGVVIVAAVAIGVGGFLVS